MGLGAVERRVLCEARRQVRVGDEELAVGYSVGFALVEELLAGVLVEGFVGDEDSAEELLDRKSVV